jgi:hypothetical protein
LSEYLVNWFGWDLPTIAASYETDMACVENEQGLINREYIWSAARAEADLDPRYKKGSND